MRVQHQQAYILHRWPYSETSWLLDVFTREHGRVTLIAKGARRLKSPWRSLIQAFLPLSISFSGKGEVQTLTNAESLSLIKFFPVEQWLCVCYVNELLMKLLHKHDAHESLFDAYHRMLSIIRQHQQVSELLLRQFETFALKEVGYAVFDTDMHKQNIVGEAYYDYHPDIGAKLKNTSQHISNTPTREAMVPCVSGKTLRFLTSENIFYQYQISSSVTELPEYLSNLQNTDTKDLSRESKILLRYIIQRVLEWRKINSRPMFIDIRQRLLKN